MAEARRNAATVEGLNGARVLIVEARYYIEISDALLAGARRTLDRAGVGYDIITVPGALELPAAIEMVFQRPDNALRYEGVIALGCVIRGDTIHFEIVSEQSARALMDLSVRRALPLGNGILTVENDSQAWPRARMQEGDKGGDAAHAALAMIALKRKLAGAG